MQIPMWKLPIRWITFLNISNPPASILNIASRTFVCKLPGLLLKIWILYVTHLWCLKTYKLQHKLLSFIGSKYPIFNWFGKTCVESSWKVLQEWESSDYLMNHFCVSEHKSMLTFLKMICHTPGAHDVKGKVIAWALLS